MVRRCRQGQILVEISVVMLLVGLVLFAGIGHLTALKESQEKYQFTSKGKAHAKKNLKK